MIKYPTNMQQSKYYFQAILIIINPRRKYLSLFQLMCSVQTKRPRMSDNTPITIYYSTGTLASINNNIEIMKNLQCFAIEMKLVVKIPKIKPTEYSHLLSKNGFIRYNVLLLLFVHQQHKNKFGKVNIKSVISRFMVFFSRYYLDQQENIWDSPKALFIIDGPSVRSSQYAVFTASPNARIQKISQTIQLTINEATRLSRVTTLILALIEQGNGNIMRRMNITRIQLFGGQAKLPKAMMFRINKMRFVLSSSNIFLVSLQWLISLK